MSQNIAIGALGVLVLVVAFLMVADRQSAVAPPNPDPATIIISQNTYPGPPYDLAAAPYTAASRDSYGPGDPVPPATPAAGVRLTWRQAAQALTDSYDWRDCYDTTTCSAWRSLPLASITELSGVYSYNDASNPDGSRCDDYTVTLRARSAGVYLVSTESAAWDTCDVP